MGDWWAHQDLNLGPADYESAGEWPSSGSKLEDSERIFPACRAPETETEPETETPRAGGRFGCPKAEDRERVSRTEIRTETELRRRCGQSATARVLAVGWQ